ncbi:FKBP-type peptidyl-prolyl cis-trans isomerase [Flavobacterium sp. SH_e]|uniref:FKBP-type peptidyl-prolyl cis-trans isomerase n=1 Tax=Flavobacterium TaxID=237 RepID=UPI0021E370EC|nr:FKBP-type peptidyl-prolyl cis-trans isomerase [Flavobacterium sp. SH_e]MCV2483791.1 FKBP-type peptidyl-prolyl cis-trans isomerase [Flavobacterium sp. SH_e]
MKKLLTVLFTLALFASCTGVEKDNSEPPKDYTEQNEQEIKDYLTKNNLTATRTDSGLYYIIDEPGDGAQPTSTSNVTVAYKGYFTSGKVFDQSKDTGISFGLNQVIKGWTEGIPYFKEGGSGVLLIPARLGYGSYDYMTIPGGSVLIFDVKLIKVN